LTASGCSGFILAVTVWHDVDERVLRWVADDLPASLEMAIVELAIRPDEPFTEIDGLMSSDVHLALLRLNSYGLVAFSHQPQETAGSAILNSPRLTALGHQSLDDWPDLDQIDAAESVRLALAAMAEEARPEKASLLQRAVGVLGEIGTSIVVGEVEKEAGKLADDAQPREPRSEA
jgi:hypothetical protein